MSEPEDIRAAAERRRLQEEANRITEEARLAEKERADAVEEMRKNAQFRNDDGSYQQRR